MAFPALTCSPVSLDPPLPVYFFNMMANLKDKSAKGYPVKKVRRVYSSFSKMLSLSFSCYSCFGRAFWFVAVVCEN